MGESQVTGGTCESRARREGPQASTGKLEESLAKYFSLNLLFEKVLFSAKHLPPRKLAAFSENYQYFTKKNNNGLTGKKKKKKSFDLDILLSCLVTAVLGLPHNPVDVSD